jgi:hypothetical protein
MSYFVYTQADIDRAVDAAIEETLRAVMRSMIALKPTTRRYDDPWRTGRNEAIGAATRINWQELHERIEARYKS